MAIFVRVRVYRAYCTCASHFPPYAVCLVLALFFFTFLLLDHSRMLVVVAPFLVSRVQLPS